MWALVLKDLEQNAKALLIFFISAIALPSIFYLFKSPGSDNSGFIGVVFSYVVFGGPNLFSFWLIGQEKVKGTLRLLKILPISGMKIIITKTLTSLCLSVILVNVLLVGVPMFLRLGGLSLSSPRSLEIVWLNLLTIFFVSVNMAIFTILDHKIASQVAYFSILALVLIVVVVEKRLAVHVVSLDQLADRIINKSGFPYWGGIIVFFLSAALIWVAGHVFERVDWPELEED